MITPQFPYSGSQAIVSSDRVTLYSKKDGVFLFGKTTIGLSSPNTINVDSNEEFRVFAPKITLGTNAKQSVILGNNLVNDLKDVYDSLQTLCVALSTINSDNFAAVVDQIRYSSRKLADVLNTKKIEIDKNLSKVTFTE